MHWLTSVFIRRRRQNELTQSIHEHLEEKVADLTASGMTQEEAEKAARREFGNVTSIEERSREVWQWPRLESLGADLQYALRQLRNNPGFACTAILILALGMAASLAIFAFVDAALLQPLPYRNPSQLVAVYASSSGCNKCDLSYQDYLDWKKDNTGFHSLEVWTISIYLWRSPEGVQDVRAARVSGGFFRTLGVTPALGRSFTDADDTPASPRTVLLTYAAWQNRFGGRKDAVGESLILDDAAYTVIGVLPQDFHFAPRAAEFWTTIHDPTSCEKTRSCHSVYALARLRDGVSIQTALANMRAIAAHLEREYPDSNKDQSAQMEPLREAVAGDIRPILLVMASGACLLLLIACVNVASLMLVRAENRRREMALRGALGASSGRLVRLFLAEGMVLAAFAVTLGLTVASVLIPLLFNLIPERRLRGLPYLRQAGLHSHVLLFALGISLLAVAVCSITPLLRLSISNLRESLAEGGRGGTGVGWRRFGSNLVVVELAIAMVLLVGAGLLGKSSYRLLHMDLNFNPENVATLEVDTLQKSYNEQQRIALSKRIVESISAMPGVISVGHTSDLPVTCNCNTTEFRVVGRPWYGDHSSVLQRNITAGYFQTIQARRISGRFFSESDDQSKPSVIVINQALAKQFFPNEDPVGRMAGDKDLAPGSLAQIVGVVDDIREGELHQEIRPAIYRPFSQDPGGGFFMTVRMAQDPRPMLPVLAAAIHRVDPNVGVRNEFVLARHVGDSPAAFLHRSSAWLVGGFAGLALLLGVIGIYGVIAYSVSRRAREIGVRMALGAESCSVYGLILKEAGWLALFGLLIALPGSIAAGIWMRSLFFGVHSWDVSILCIVAAVLIASALLASYIPARHAASINPIDALRAE